MANHPKFRILRRAAIYALLAPIFSVGLFCATNAYSIYAHNRAVNRDVFPAARVPRPSQSILIVSPHPDDETLGTAGLMQDAVSAGVPVHVVFMTDGDAFRVGVAAYYHILRVRPSDYLRYGAMREGEARAALRSLGLSDSDITFLGYPDQGTLPIWLRHWSSADRYTSPYTRASAVPYADAFDPGAPYCGESIVADLEAQIIRDRPTDIYTTHPSDDHPDHAAAPAFVNVALDGLVAHGYAWASTVRVHYFIVHRGDWPAPQGLDEDDAMAPPAPLIRLDTDWKSLDLAPLQVERKDVALGRYASQLDMMSRFLDSFVRTNEMFGTIPEYDEGLVRVPDGQITVNGDSRDWPDIAPLDREPAPDSVIRAFQPGADLRDIYACADSRSLYVRIDTQTSISSDDGYRLFVRAFSPSGATADSAVTLDFSARNLAAGQETPVGHGATAAYDGRTLEFGIPLAALGVRHPSRVYIDAVTIFSRVQVDRSGIRCGRLSAQPRPALGALS